MTPCKKAAIDISGVDSQLRAIERSDGTGTLEIDSGISLRVSSLAKPYFPEVGVTKGALMRYYTRIWLVLQPHLQDRALVLKRYPDGVGGPMFFQQNAGAKVPSVVRVETLETEDEGPKPRIIGGDLATLLYTVQLGAIEVHPWLSRVGDTRSPDRCLIDLDPGDDVPFSEVVSLARDVRDIIGQCGLSAAVKTSGSSGIHLVIPLPPRTSYEKSAQLALQIARVVVHEQPTRATMERLIKARPTGTIYVDALQNARGKSMAGAYSVRARAEATVSAPIRERELSARLRTAAFTVSTMPARVARLGDLWGDGLSSVPASRTLTTAMAVLEKVLNDTADDAPPSTKPAREKRRSSEGGSGARATGKRRSRRG